MVGPSYSAREIGPELVSSRDSISFEVQSGEYLGNALGDIAVRQHSAFIVSPKTSNPHFQGGTQVRQE